MAGELASYFDTTSTQDIFTSALQFGANSSFVTPRTSDTVTSDAVNGAVPIDNIPDTGWSGFFRDTARALVGYGLTKDAQQSGIAQPGQAPMAPVSVQVAQQRNSTLLLIALAVGGAFLLLKE
jgi:hypothetical protein